MSHKIALPLAVVAVFAVAVLASTASYARSVAGFGGHGFGMARGSSRPIGRVLIRSHGPTHQIARRPTTRLCVLGRPCPPNPPLPPIWVWHHHHQHHWVFRGGRWIDDMVEVSSAVVPSTAAPCSCLRKTYAPTGLVVFADVCTEESASAPATEDHADSQAPASSIAANPELAQPGQSPAAPQQN